MKKDPEACSMSWSPSIQMQAVNPSAEPFSTPPLARKSYGALENHKNENEQWSQSNRNSTPSTRGKKLSKRAYQNQAMSPESLTDILLRAKRSELEMAVDRIESMDAIMLQSNPKPLPAKNGNASKYRGVFKNGNKWQVRLRPSNVGRCK